MRSGGVSSKTSYQYGVSFTIIYILFLFLLLLLFLFFTSPCSSSIFFVDSEETINITAKTSPYGNFMFSWESSSPTRYEKTNERGRKGERGRGREGEEMVKKIPIFFLFSSSLFILIFVFRDGIEFEISGSDLAVAGYINGQYTWYGGYLC